MTDLHNPKVQEILHSQAFAQVATIGAKGEPQSSPMWFLWDGEYIKLAPLKESNRHKNIKRDPHIAISISDIGNPYVYAEFRGMVEKIEEDPAGASYTALAKRYGSSPYHVGEPRVILSVKIQRIIGQNL
ncbi:PPOX class F420-dependent oxidoreductase [Ktedonosporobacter rubrisoli]|uniref:PPOX class F420-dependent oxidoreductase n=1 Tax=Ktedonosporobacter rubrisoli TaxID=2509675 RepID=A0A4P6K4C7_KTERU|nr:PPOX class F420-dependent oxidoreductase [Ktedonosporobacter rubrisoli]QBD82376.1 PPOX class F420-dependent oxidoreductase [Ktedonosporobacter rubrisoli]